MNRTSGRDTPADVARAVNASAEAFLSPTKLGDRYVLRLAIGNVRTERRHVARAWELLRDASERMTATASR